MEDVQQPVHRTPWSFPLPSHRSPAFLSSAIISVKSVKLSAPPRTAANALWPRLSSFGNITLGSILEAGISGLAGPGGLDVERVDVCARPAEGPAW